MKQTICEKVSEGKPPTSNTGAETPDRGLRALLDWCSFTLIVDDVGQVQQVLQIPSTDWVQMPQGGKGYKAQLRCGDISIFYDGSPDMGINVNMSGQGCRQYEDRFGCAWPDLIKRVFELDGHFTRLDGAIDDFHGFFSLEQVSEKVESRDLKSRFRNARVYKDYDLTTETGKSDGKTIKFGSGKSNMQIRIYDKAAQQGVDQVWIRTEIQCRHERADVFARHIISNNDLGHLLGGVLHNYLNFLEPSDDSHRDRWPVSSWWSEFLGNVEKVRLTVFKATKTIEEKMEWIDHQISTSLALIGLYLKERGRNGYDVYEFVSDLLISGEKRLKPRHLALLQAE